MCPHRSIMPTMSHMRFIASSLITLSILLTSVAGITLPRSECTLTSSGGDDAPQFLNAVKACSTVTIPASTALNIQTRLNMTGLRNKHIVS